MKQTILQFIKELPRFLKYQIITKSLFGLFVLPIFWLLSELLIKRAGVQALSNDNLLKFIFSFNGLLFILLSLILVLIMTVVELYGFIVLSAQIIEGEEETGYRQLVEYNFKSVCNLLEKGFPLILIYLILFLPITGNGVVLDQFSQFKIPNFIMAVIESTPLYLGIYVIGISVLSLICFYMIFVLHYIVLKKDKPSVAIGKSFRLVFQNFFSLVKEILNLGLIVGLSIAAIILLWLIGIFVVSELINFNSRWGQAFLLLLLMLQMLGLEIGKMIFVPFEMFHLTKLFYQYEQVDSIVLAKKKQIGLLDRVFKHNKLVTAILFIGLLALSYLFSHSSQEFLSTTTIPEVIAHRGGKGNENSLSAIQNSIDNGYDAIEIDIQRSKDDHYVVNHDSNLKRLFNDSRKVKELSLEELKQLSFKDGEKIATLDEVLALTKDKINLYIELKGETANQQMADDMIKLLKEKNMVSQATLTSLNYDLISYINKQYPEINSGFIYFISVGNPSTFSGNVLIMEEEMATESNITSIQSDQKKAIVWTINDSADMIKMIDLNVDGIITDHSEILVEILNDQINKSAKERLLEKFFLLEE